MTEQHKIAVFTIGIEMINTDDNEKVEPNMVGEMLARFVRSELRPRQGFIHIEQLYEGDLDIADMLDVTRPEGARRMRDLNAEDAGLESGS